MTFLLVVYHVVQIYGHLSWMLELIIPLKFTNCRHYFYTRWNMLYALLFYKSNLMGLILSIRHCFFAGVDLGTMG